MNKVFAETKEYGSLYLDEIFLFYDIPLIFSVINPLGYRYIVVFESENSTHDCYLLVPVSFSRYQQFVSNKITIRSVFEHPEMGEVLAVYCFPDKIESAYLKKEELLLKNLPPEGEYLDIKESYTREEILRKSVEGRCGIAQISFEKNGTHRQTIKAKELSIITAKLQKIMYGIQKDWLNGDGVNASNEKKRRMSDAAELNISRTYAASFGLEFESNEVRDLLNESEFDYYMQKFLELISYDGEFEENYYACHKKSISAIRDYYKTLMTNRFAIKVQAALPNRTVGRICFSIEDITKRYNYLTSVIDGKVEQLEVKGFIVAFDIKNRTFKFQIEDGELISGKIDVDFSETVFDTATRIKILVDHKIEILAPGDESDKYVLLSVI